MTRTRLVRGLLLGVNGALLVAFALQFHVLLLGDRTELSEPLPELERLDELTARDQDDYRGKAEDALVHIYAEPKPAPDLEQVLEVPPVITDPGLLAGWRVTAFVSSPNLNCAFVEHVDTEVSPRKRSKRDRRKRAARAQRGTVDRDCMIEGQRFRDHPIVVERVDRANGTVLYRDVASDRVYTIEMAPVEDLEYDGVIQRGHIVPGPEGGRP